MVGRLQGKVIVVTGAARGIGAAIARIFAGEGARLGLIDLDIVTLQPLADELAAGGADAIAAIADIADKAAVTKAVEQIRRHFGHVDGLVNNAGINVFADPLKMSEDDWARCMAVNLEGAWHVIRAVLPDMLQVGKGSIINIASTHAFAIIPGCFPYPVAKHGLIGLTRSLAVEYAPQGVRVNAIAPGYIETDKVKDWINQSTDPAATRARIEGLIPLRRIGEPEEVAWAAVYLISDESAFTTGSILTMDGGRSVVYHD